MSKKKNRTQVWYLKQVRKILIEISTLGKDQGVAFLRLKKRAEKYIKKAKEIKDGE